MGRQQQQQQQQGRDQALLSLKAWFMVSSAAGNSATRAASCGGGSHSYLMCCSICGSNWMEKIWLSCRFSRLKRATRQLSTPISLLLSLLSIGCRRLKFLHNSCSDRIVSGLADGPNWWKGDPGREREEEGRPTRKPRGHVSTGRLGPAALNLI